MTPLELMKLVREGCAEVYPTLSPENMTYLQTSLAKEVLKDRRPHKEVEGVHQALMRLRGDRET